MKIVAYSVWVSVMMLLTGFLKLSAQTSCYETAILPTDTKWGGGDVVGSVLIGNTYNAGQGPGIYIVADGGYRLYLNGELLAFDNAAGRVRFIPMTFLPMKNVISIVGINGQNAPGVLMHLDELEKPYVTSSTWKANASVVDNSWKNKSYSDAAWSNASVQTSGTLSQTPSGISFTGFPQTSTARWIWSSNANDKNVVLRYSFTIKAVGFGESTTGGDGGQIVVVKTLAELNKAVTATTPMTILIPEGTLDIRTFRKEPNSNFCQTPCGKILPGGPSVGVRQGIDSAACAKEGGKLVDVELWNTFIRPQSNKSIIGMGRGASLRGATIYSHQNDVRANIIVRNLKIWDVNPHVIEARDGILLTNASKVWVDHCSFKWISDGNDMSGMKKITFSWNKWDGYNEFVCSTRDNYSALVQNTDVTFDHIYWFGANGRVPKTYGADTVRVHMINNYHFDNTFYASHSNGPTNLVYIENSHYNKVRFPTQRVSGGVIYSSGNLFEAIEKHVLDNYAATTEPKDLAAKFKIPYSYTLDPVGDVKTIVTTNAGAGGKWGTMPTYSDVTSWSKAAPTTSITSPTEGASFANPTSITVSANASDVDGSITKVEFYSGNVLIGTSTKSPYTINFTSLATCRYSLVAVAYDNNGLKTMSLPITITVNTCTPIINASGVTTFCSGGNVLLSTSTGSSYIWRNGTTQVGTSASFRASASGSYTVEVVNANGCKATSKPLVVSVNPRPTATIKASGATTFCNGGSVPLTSSTGSTYVWRNGTTTVGTTANYLAKTGGLYTVIVTNASGCKDTSIATIVKVNALPTATITSPTNSFCTGGNVVLTSSAGTSYVWRNGTTTVGTASSYTAKTIGSYTVIVTNASGCKDTSAVKTITENPLPVLTHNTKTDYTAWTQGQIFTACLGDDLYTGPWPNLAAGWLWTGPNGFSSTLRSQVFNAIKSNQAGKYTATYTDPKGCSASMDLTIVVSIPSATITSPATSFCPGGNVVLNANKGTSYVWRNGTMVVGNSSTYTAKTAGLYTVTVTNSSGCKDTSAVKAITISPVPVVSILSPANNATLTTDVFPINASVSGSNISNVSFYNGNTLFGTDASSPYTFSTPSLSNGTYTFSAIAKNTFNCTETAKVTVKVNKIVTAILLDEEVESNAVTCTPNPFFDSFELKAKGNYFIFNAKGSLMESGHCQGNCIVGSNLSSGMYYLEIAGSAKPSKMKLIKQ